MAFPSHHAHDLPHSTHDIVHEEIRYDGPPELHDDGHDVRPVRFGPGFRSAAPEASIQYILVTPEMLEHIHAGE